MENDVPFEWAGREGGSGNVEPFRRGCMANSNRQSANH